MSGGENDALGYKRPPRWTRFKPGQSGNPKGRPKRGMQSPKLNDLSSQLDGLLRADLDRVVTVNEGGKTKRKTARELVIRAQVNAAAKGNVHAQQHVIRTMRELEERKAQRAEAQARAEAEQREQDIKLYHYMVDKKRARARIWAAAAAEGREPEQPWPHPDDILLYPAKQHWEWRGSYQEADVPYYRWCAAQRDYLFADAILRDFKNPRASQARRDFNSVLWISFDMMLPLRGQAMPGLESELEIFYSMSVPKMQKLVNERCVQAERARILAGVSNNGDKETYRTVNAMLKPVLKRFGYRPLAEFEDCYERLGDEMPWPKGTRNAKI